MSSIEVTVKKTTTVSKTYTAGLDTQGRPLASIQDGKLKSHGITVTDLNCSTGLQALALHAVLSAWIKDNTPPTEGASQ